MHPRIQALFAEEIEALPPAPYVLVEVALLFDNFERLKALFDESIAVLCDKATALQRAMQRDNATSDAIEARQALQCNDAIRSKLATYTVRNDTSNTVLYPQLEALHHTLLAHAIP